MKYHFLVAVSLALVFAACAGGKELERSIIASGYDFTPYTAKGFLITPEEYLQPYESIGMIKVAFYPEVKKAKSDPFFDPKKYTEIRGFREIWIVENIDVHIVIGEAYKNASKMGADGIVRFTVDVKPMNNGEITYPAYEVTGFAIKRK